MSTAATTHLAGSKGDGPGAGTLRAFVTSLLATGVFVGVVLLAAGRFGVWQAWVYAGLSLGLNVGQRLVLRDKPDLVRERARPGAGARGSDKALLALGLLLTLAMLATAGFELRSVGHAGVSLGWFGAGLLLQLAGASLFLWALRENAFFSAVVRVQADRQHAVCSTGPYRFVRHPGNLGMIIGTAGFPLLFLAPWSSVPAGAFIVTLIVRTHLEDRLLARELDGYRDYQQRTRYRLVPGLW